MISDPIDSFVNAAAQALRLELDEAWKPAIRMNLQLVFRHAELIDAFPLPEDAEPAPIFKA
jgi:hypothetical protein